MNIIRELLEAKPDTKFDEAWAKNLRARFDQGFVGNQQTLQKDKIKKTPFCVFEWARFFKKIFNQIKSMNKLYKYSGAVAFVAILFVALGSIYIKDKDSRLAFMPEITKVQNNAFGSLSSSQGPESLMRGEGLGSGSAEMSDSGVLRTTESFAVDSMVGYGGGGADMKEIGIFPEPRELKYVYVGEDFSLEDDTVQVLRRVTGMKASQSVISQIQKFDFGIANLGAFGNVSMQNINFIQDIPFGYNVGINFTEGSISIHENWEQWDNPLYRCQDEVCYEQNRISISDVPNDAELISIANAFLAKHGVSVKSYGEPLVDNSWRIWYESAIARGDTKQAYAPETIMVKYPLLINDQIVFDQGGSSVGIMVNVSIRHKLVMSMWGLRTQQYESSGYRAVKDKEKVLEYALRGGNYGLYYHGGLESGSYPEEIELGTPQKVLIQMWNWSNNKSSELFVPGLMFPVVSEVDQNYYHVRSVVVPLALELFESQEFPEVRPMPFEIMDMPVSDEKLIQ